MQPSVKLVSYTQPACDELSGMNTLEMIAYTARVSNPSNQHNNETAERLVSYCAKNQHWSVFEMVDATLEIITTRDIGRQILRHRSFSFQEFSQRYADPTKSLDFLVREARLQDKKNRQNSIELEDGDDELIAEWERLQEEHVESAKRKYAWAIEHGIAKEQARAVLPEGMTMSKMYMKGSLRSWIHYIQLRSGNGTQKEHREIALMTADELGKIFPYINYCVQGD